MFRQWHLAVTLLVAAPFVGNLTSCSGKSPPGWEAQSKYDEAVEQLLDGDFTQAATQFEQIANSTVNPVLTQLATLRMADALFYQGRHAEAAEVYREFLVQFAGAADAPHAHFMRGLSYIERMPEDSWILPPAESREMSEVDSAYDSFVTLIRQYPSSLYALRARPLLEKVVTRRCRHHVYVARYYEDRGNHVAVVQRMETALSEESLEIERERVSRSYMCATMPANLLLTAKSYHKIGDLTGIIKILKVFEVAPERYAKDQRVRDRIVKLAQDLQDKTKEK